MLKFWGPRALEFYNFGAMGAPKWGGGGGGGGHDTRSEVTVEGDCPDLYLPLALSLQL